MRHRTLVALALPTLAALVAVGCDSATSAPADTSDAADSAELDTAAPDTAAPDTVDPSPGLGIDYSATAPGGTPRFAPEETDWMAVGWPSDRYLKDGHLDLSVFRGLTGGLFETYLDLGEQVLDGFGLNGAVYFELDGTLDVATLPTPEASMSETGHVQLVNATVGSARFGERVPLLFRWYGGGADVYYRARTLAMHPVYGFPLAEHETYCAVVTRAVQDADGNYLQAAPAFLAALDADPALAPLRAWLPTSPLRKDDLAVATCFTTAAPTDELRRISAWITAHDAPEVETVSEPGVFGELQGLYLAPNFQSGDKPYDSEGDGAILFDSAGDPIVQEQEQLRFLLLLPRDRPMPPGGWPTVIYAHGTGGDYESCRGVSGELNASGHAVLCIDEPLHGPRGPDLDYYGLVLNSFNFVNPAAGRSSFRQAAIDVLTLSHMVASGRFDLPVNHTASGDAVVLDPDRIFFFGHSHGGLSGALAFAVDPRIRGGILSGTSGVLVETILRRKDPADLAALVQGFLGVTPGDLDSFHPAMTLVQMLVDETDPINYGPYWLHPGPGGRPKHVLLTEGTEDADAPSVGTDALGAAAGLPLVLPLAKDSPAHRLRGLATLTLPVTLNASTADGPRTAAMKQYQHGTHFTAFDDPEARALWNELFRTFAADEPPTIGLGPDAAVPAPATTSPGDACADAPAIDAAALPLELRGNTSLAGLDLASAGATCGDRGADGRDLTWRFTAPADGRYRFALTLPPAIDSDTPRFGPDLVYLLADGCDAAGCVAARSGSGALEVDLASGDTYIVVVDGSSWEAKGPFGLTVSQRCAVQECGDRECGIVGCGSCGDCGGGQYCDAAGRCQSAGPGDTCADPIEVAALPFAHTGDTGRFHHDYSYSVTDCPTFPFRFGAKSSDVVFHFTAPSAGVYTAELASGFDGNLFAVTDCADIGGSCLGASRNGYGDERLALTLGAGEAVFVIAQGAFNNSNLTGPYTFRLTSCVPDCVGKSCGDDGCGGSCGPCAATDSCVEAASCDPIPSVCEQSGACEDLPGNTCASAIPIGALPFSDSQDTADFTSEYGYGAGWCPGVDATWGFAAADVAYAFTAPTDGLYRFQLATGSGLGAFDANLYLVTDCDDVRGSCLAADERDRDERVWRQFTSGESAYVVVDGWSNVTPQTGDYTLSVSQCTPTCENRECGGDGCNGSCGSCGAKQACSQGHCVDAFGLRCGQERGVGNLPWSHTDDTSNWENREANTCPGVPVSGDGSNDVTYQFKAPKDATFTFAVEAAFDAQLYVVSDCANVAGTCLATGGTVHQVALAKDELVHIIVDGAPSGGAVANGPYTLRVSETCFPQCDGRACGADGCGGSCGACPAPADICTGAGACLDPTSLTGNTCDAPFAVGALPFSGSGDTRAAYNHYDVPANGCAGWVRKGTGSAEQVWSFTAPAAGDYRIAVAPAGWDAFVYVVADCADLGGSCLAASDGQADEALRVTLAAAQTVFVVVDGEDDVSDDAGAYALTVTAED